MQTKVLIVLFLFLFFLSNLTQKFQVIPEEYLKQLLTQYKRCRYNHPNVLKNIRSFWACPRNVPHKCFTNISKVSVFPISSELPLLYVNVTFLWSYFQMPLSIYHAKNPLVLEIEFIIVNILTFFTFWLYSQILFDYKGDHRCHSSTFPISKTKYINQFHASSCFVTPLKKSENLWFSDISRGCAKRPVAWD